MINIKRKRWIITNNTGDVLIGGANGYHFVNPNAFGMIFCVTFESKNTAILAFNKTNYGPYDGETYKAVEVTEIITDCDEDEEEN